MALAHTVTTGHAARSVRPGHRTFQTTLRVVVCPVRFVRSYGQIGHHRTLSALSGMSVVSNRRCAREEEGGKDLFPHACAVTEKIRGDQHRSTIQAGFCRANVTSLQWRDVTSYPLTVNPVSRRNGHPSTQPECVRLSQLVHRKPRSQTTAGRGFRARSLMNFNTLGSRRGPGPARDISAGRLLGPKACFSQIDGGWKESTAVFCRLPSTPVSRGSGEFPRLRCCLCCRRCSIGSPLRGVCLCGSLAAASAENSLGDSRWRFGGRP